MRKSRWMIVDEKGNQLFGRFYTEKQASRIFEKHHGFVTDENGVAQFIYMWEVEE